MLHAMVLPAHRGGAARPALVSPARVAVSQRCYRVGQKVAVDGSGFGAATPYDLSIDGVDFGQSVTTAAGTFSTGLYPGGLGAGQVQIRDRLTASDGNFGASTSFTVTRATGALFGSAAGGSPRRAVPFEVWDFAPTGPQASIYLHYVAPSGRAARTVRLGRTGGQCGLLRTARRQLFPFNPSRGSWTLQFDTARRYRSRPTGKVARLRIAIS